MWWRLSRRQINDNSQQDLYYNNSQQDLQ